MPGRGWRPGSIQTNVMKVIDTVKTKQSRDKKTVKTTRSAEHSRKVESARAVATGGGDAQMFLPVDLTPTLHLHKKRGIIYVSMKPPGDKRNNKGKQTKKQTSNPQEAQDDTASDDYKPVQFRIDPKNVDGEDGNSDLYETEDTSTNTEDSFELELVAPSTLKSRLPKPITVDMEVQVTEEAFATVENTVQPAEKTEKKKSILSKKSRKSQKLRKNKKSTGKT